jgi:AcrR family transcriptional regulator
MSAASSATTPTRGAPSRPRDTRERLIATAEALFAAQGLDGVSLNEITKAAGQRNASALHYHFGGKEGLLAAILEKHQPALDAERERMLDSLLPAKDRSLRDLAKVLVMPLVEKLEDPDGGSDYIRVMAQLIGSPRHSFLDTSKRTAQAGGDRLLGAISDRVGGLSPSNYRMRTLLVISLLFHGLSDFARLRESALIGPTHRRHLVSSLLDGIVGILASEESK